MLKSTSMYKKIIFTLLFIIILWVAYYGISPLFKNTTLNEPIPENTAREIENNSLGVVSGGTSTNNITKSEIAQNDNTLKVETSALITGTSGHPASGEIKIITSDTVKNVRYENFKTINGPDLYVYLSKDLQAKDFISLGKLKATEGNINYAVPENINIQDYSYVIVWCKAFGVLFNSADISKLTK